MGVIATTPADTHHDVYRMQLEMLGRLDPNQRMANVNGIFEAIGSASIGVLRRRFPEADEMEIRARLVAQRYGPALAESAYGWSPTQTDGFPG